MTSKALRRVVLLSSLAIAVPFAESEAQAQPRKPAQPAPAQPPPAAGEPTEKELQDARDLFQEAFKDEQEKRYEVALEKFRRVAQVKESVQVRYRIASVLESLNRLRESRDAYRACAAMRANLPTNQQNVADACAEKALAVDKKVPKIIVTISGDSPPADARVTVDGAPVPTGRPIEQDPGEHTVQGTATGMKPFEQKVTLPENGSQIPATVTFEPVKGPETPPGGGGGHDLKGGGPKLMGWMFLGAGAIVTVVGVALLVIREGEIDDINKLCPNPNACNPVNRPVVEDKSDTADTYLPLGIGVTAVGVLAMGFGAYTVFIKKNPPPASDPSQQPAQGTNARIDIGPRMVRGGAMFGLSGTF